MASRSLLISACFLSMLLVFGPEAAPSLASDYGQCVQDCVDASEADKQACRDELDQALADIDAAFERCLEETRGDDDWRDGRSDDGDSPRECVEERNRARREARREFVECIQFANQTRKQCIDDCQQSPSEP